MTLADVEITEEYRKRLESIIPKDLPPEVDIFDEHAARRGFRLNRAGYSLKDEHQRTLYKEAQERWMEQFGLDEEERDLIRRLDWIGMWRHGMSIYVMVKLAAVTGTALPQIGKQMKEAQ
jgi:protocatechuate 4,5-dioxygenase alpha chain